ncbi:HYD1 signature containing ADP-ribosyltransferase family protein [Spirillospora sp. NBC_01491]|uniref:HYD1 signature containing ADP-ribosyltransferase family protein n=1 Tax=Spirillospora sp. NBC_01491 TaxID=2976007 RepID=UPI003FA7B974
MERDDSDSAVNQRSTYAVLWHYTDAQGLRAIRESCVLLPSLRASNPQDARYGDGQYLSDVPPGSMPPERLSRRLMGVPWLGWRFTHYVEMDMAGLALVLCKRSIILLPGREPLGLSRRIVRWGANEWSGT